MVKQKRKLIKTIPKYKLELRRFSQELYSKMGLSDKQIIALEALQDPNISEIAYGGGAGGGKSYLGATWLFLMAEAFPETRWFVGRKELKSLRRTTFSTFKKVFKKYNYPDSKWKYNGQDNFLQFENGSQIDFLQLMYMPSDPLYERLGSFEYTGGWIDEGGEIPFDAYDTVKTRIGRQLNDQYFGEDFLPKVLTTCNPKKNWLYHDFYKPYRDNDLPKNKVFIRSLVIDNPFIEKRYKEALEGIKDKSKRARLLEGEWEYTDDPSMLVEYDDILNVFTNEYVSDEPVNHKYITADIALQGSDKFVLGVWYDWHLVKIVVLDKSDGSEVENTIKDLARKHKVKTSNIAYDADGLGAYLRGYLGNAYPFVNNASPILKKKLNSENKPDRQEQYFREEFANLKSQCGFHLADRINDGAIYVSDWESEKQKETIIEELELLRNANYGTDRKSSLLRKEDMKGIIGRSPDYLDMMLMRSIFDLQPKTEIELPFYTG